MVNEKARIKDENAEYLKEAANTCPRNIILFDERNPKNNEKSAGFGQRRGRGLRRAFGVGQRSRGRIMGRRMNPSPSSGQETAFFKVIFIPALVVKGGKILSA